MQEEIYAKKLIVLREEVRMMFNKMENEVDQLEFIDVLQRLGVDYHFNNEIRNMLDNIYNTQTSNLKNNNLYVTALKFRLLRQHGYDISTDVFVCFRDEMLDLKTDHAIDVEGMLSMYEASFHSFEDETILDEARDFTIKFLKDYLNKHGDDDVMSILISHAFEIPLHLRISRSEAQWFIDQYQKNKNMSPILLQFAKVDYNILQSIYQEELKYDSRWWKGTGYEEKLTFARDRIVENYIWSVGTNFNPNSGYFRKYTTKILSLITTLDDVYDVYGTLEELELFTEAIDRWDLNGMDSLPNYMKICFEPIYNFVNELAFDVQNKSGCDITPHLKKAWIDLCKTYLVEAKWYHIGSTPNFEEYLENAWKSIGSAVILIHGFCYFQPEDSVCVEENLNIIHFSATILRLANDLGTYKRELETGDIPKSIQLYMNENDASETEAREYVKSLILTLWKKMNKEAHTSSFSRSFVDISINLARMSLFMYLRGDAHTVQDSDVKNRVVSLIFQHVPIMSTME
ncbi:myrcene synthase, chloroplastic-like [Vicia villosa]|uniref:myrcene synthase, chloroplastic-like n=1 Tax=Vicia villosa TaxID=3911 RepID=UPI00273C7D35|nr:myrcene synthase, chloroplastic-like [Vicia villosa]